MSSRHLLYLALSVVALVALIGSAALVLNYRPNGVAADLPTASPRSQMPTSSLGPGETAAPIPTDAPASEQPATPAPPETISPIDPLAKDAVQQSLDPEELTGYVWPVRNALITSRMRARDFGGFVVIDGQEVHDGLDLATYCGDRVRAAHDGTVLYAGRNFDPYIGYWGDASPIYDRLERLGRVNQQPIVVVIDDGNGYRSMYVHLERASVEPGQVVAAGDVIGREGMTGFATGCHLHYTMIRMDGAWQEVVPGLARYGYPPYVRERVDALKVLPWGDDFAPQRLRDRIYGTPSPSPSVNPSGTPEPSAVPTSTPSESASPTGSN
jgi:murein DD-endopeptidase MepM/ murein hydrolase activator NlpD